MFYLAAPTTSTSVATTTTAPPCISSSFTGYLSQYSVIAFQNLKATSNIAYRTIVCGNFTASSATYGSQLLSTFNAGTYSLEINGATTTGNSINIDKGSLGLGPSSSTRVVRKGAQSNQYRIDGNFDVNLNQGSSGATAQVDNTLPSRCTDIIDRIKYVSTSLSQLPANNFITLPSTQPAPLYFNVTNIDANGIAVFNVSLSSVFGNSNVQRIEVNPINTGVQLVVINVYGSSVTWTAANLAGNWFTTGTYGSSRTIWNMYQATSLTFGSSMIGTVLAPLATLTINIPGDW